MGGQETVRYMYSMHSKKMKLIAAGRPGAREARGEARDRVKAAGRRTEPEAASKVASCKV